MSSFFVPKQHLKYDEAVRTIVQAAEQNALPDLRRTYAMDANFEYAARNAHQKYTQQSDQGRVLDRVRLMKALLAEGKRRRWASSAVSDNPKNLRNRDAALYSRNVLAWIVRVRVHRSCMRSEFQHNNTICRR